MPDLLAWVEATQPDSFLRLTKTHGAGLAGVLAEHVLRGVVRVVVTVGSGKDDNREFHALATSIR